MSGKNDRQHRDSPPANLPPQYAGLWEHPDKVVTLRTTDPRTGNTITRYADGHTEVAPPHKPGRSQSAKDKASAANRARLQSEQVSTADAAQGYVWVNGQRMRITAVDAHGNPTALSYEQADGSQAKQPTQLGTVFNALNLTDIPNAAAQFLMSTGIQRDAEGNETGSYQGVSRMGRGDMSLGPTGRNMMTIENGLQWFANLATKDKHAYQALVGELQSAGYLPNSGATGTTQFGADAAHAMALAMRDLAVVNQTSGGVDTDLETFLTSAKSAQAGVRSKAEAAYQPVNREYQDPATLAAQAKAAAQDALGRVLTPDEEKRFEASFRGKENSMYDAVDASGRSQAGASAVGESSAGASFYRPDGSGEAQAYVDSPEFEQERAGVAIGKYGDIIKQMVGL